MRAILTYHSVDASGSPISVSPMEFRAHCDFLAAGRVRVLPLTELLARPGEDDAVALTFDDAFANFWEEAAPELEARGLPATVFAVTDHVGGHNSWGGRQAPGIPHLPLMTWDQLGRLGERGFTVGAHTRTHPVLAGLAAARLDDELGGAAALLAERLGERPVTFAYPYGVVDAAAASRARAHFALSVTTELRVLRASEDPARLPRLDMFYLRTAGLLERWGSAAFRSHLWVRSRARELRRMFTSPVPVSQVA